MCVWVVDQGALGPVTTQWPLPPEGFRGQLRPPPMLDASPSSSRAPQPERPRYTQSVKLDGSLGKTEPEALLLALARILTKQGMQAWRQGNLVSLESTTLTHITHRQHVRGHLRQMAQEAIPLKLHTSHFNPMCPGVWVSTQSFGRPPGQRGVWVRG